MTRFILFVRDVIDGYEPALARAIVVAVFVLLAAFGIGSGALPPQADAVLIFLTFIVPIVGGWLTRRKVMPVAKSVELLPENPYPAGLLDVTPVEPALDDQVDGPLTLHLRCPVRTCKESFDIVMSGDTYGVIPVSDTGCAEITRAYSAGVDEHIAAHWADGTAGAELNAQIEAWANRRRAILP